MAVRQGLTGKASPAPKTLELYRYLLDRLILPTLGPVQLVDITPARVALGGRSTRAPSRSRWMFCWDHRQGAGRLLGHGG